MLVQKLFLCILVLQIRDGLAKRNCDDCQLLTTCKAATDLIHLKEDDDTRKLFMNAFCGLSRVGKLETIKVCCSDFSQTFKQRNDSAERLLPEKCGIVLNSRLLGGRRTLPNQFPWTALISYRTRDGHQFQCGGSVINSKYILTAAHCVLNKNIVGVRIGEHDITTEIDCEYTPLVSCEDHVQDFLVNEIISHEKYNKSTGLNNVALLRLQGEINFDNTNIEPICLPASQTHRNINLDNTAGVLAGWGFTETSHESPVLLQSHVNLTSDAECSMLHSRYNRDPINKLCTRNLNGECIGDIGGPLIIPNEFNGTYRYVQYGVNILGPVECGDNVPSVFTDVRKYIDWILDHIKE